MFNFFLCCVILVYRIGSYKRVDSMNIFIGTYHIVKSVLFFPKKLIDNIQKRKIEEELREEQDIRKKKFS